MATTTEDGRPHLVPVTFAADGNYIYTAVDAKPKSKTTAGLRRLRNIRADPRVAVLADHYEDLCAIDGRLVLAGEHASYLPAWQEGAILSALNAVERLHRRALNQ